MRSISFVRRQAQAVVNEVYAVAQRRVVREAKAAAAALEEETKAVSVEESKEVHGSWILENLFALTTNPLFTLPYSPAYLQAKEETKAVSVEESKEVHDSWILEKSVCSYYKSIVHIGLLAGVSTGKRRDKSS